MEELTQKYLKECLTYYPDTGMFTWKHRPICHFKDGAKYSAKSVCTIWNTKYANTVSGYKNNQDYISIGIDSKLYLAHRLAWLYYYGYLPENKIDHIDRARDNNRIINLREVGDTCSMQNTGEYSNNTSGVKGVGWVKACNKWRARITVHRKEISLGSFSNLNDAVKARWKEERDNDLWDCWTSSSAYNYLAEKNLLEEA